MYIYLYIHSMDKINVINSSLITIYDIVYNYFLMISLVISDTISLKYKFI